MVMLESGYLRYAFIAQLLLPVPSASELFAFVFAYMTGPRYAMAAELGCFRMLTHTLTTSTLLRLITLMIAAAPHPTA